MSNKGSSVSDDIRRALVTHSKTKTMNIYTPTLGKHHILFMVEACEGVTQDAR